MLDDTSFDDMPIIGTPGSKQRAGALTIRAGSDLGLEIELSWASEKEAAGVLTLRFSGRRIWRSFGLEPDKLGRMLASMGGAWSGLRAGQPCTLDEVFGAGMGMTSIAHDMASATHLSSLETEPPKFSRRGDDMSIILGKEQLLWPFGDVLHSLTVLGDGVAARLHAVASDREKEVAAWEARDRDVGRMPSGRPSATAG